MYKVLTGFEDSGRCRRGYFVDSLGGAQFSTSDVVDRLRSYDEPKKNATAVVLASCDPANPYGGALPWPKAGGEDTDDTTKHRPGRKAGALVVLVRGELTMFVERGGKSVLTFGDNTEDIASAATALATTVKRGGVDKLLVERINGHDIHGTDFSKTLTAAGFSATPRGLRLRR
jgi:ATP-dependent Lhr-like helicase